MPVVVLTTVGADFDARSLAHALVEARLAACVNIVPAIHSIYRWQGRVMDDSEQLLIIKTTGERVEELRAELFKRHPYDVPEFVVIAMDLTSDAYGAWIAESVNAAPNS